MNAVRILFLFFVLIAAPAVAQDGGITRVEHNDPSVTYSGNWWTNTSNSHSGGLAALTNTAGARATITFTGTGITWVGMKDGWAGLANLHLDGSMVVVVTYGSGGYQQVLYSAQGLAHGTHTLTIEVTHERNAQTEGSWVWIDAFLIHGGVPVPGAIGRIEENHATLLFSGRWFST